MIISNGKCVATSVYLYCALNWIPLTNVKLGCASQCSIFSKAERRAGRGEKRKKEREPRKKTMTTIRAREETFLPLSQQQVSSPYWLKSREPTYFSPGFGLAHRLLPSQSLPPSNNSLCHCEAWLPNALRSLTKLLFDYTRQGCSKQAHVRKFSSS